MTFPIARWLVIDDARADVALVRWGHWLGACDRPFGRVSYGLEFEEELVAVAVSASTVNGSCPPFRRTEIIELARLCAHPDHRDLTRVALRLWRKTAPVEWSRQWAAQALVSYANSLRHSGDIYRFDGWIRIGDRRASNGGGRQKGTRAEPKSLWAYPLTDEARARCMEYVAGGNASASIIPLEGA